VNSVFDCNIVGLEKVKNRAGNLSSVQNLNNIPFEINRVYYIYDVPGGSDRGGHAHKELEQFVIAVSGAFDVLLDDGVNKTTIRLDRPNNALHIKKGIWRETRNFTSGSICMVIASHPYDPDDYINEYENFKLYRHQK
jgi:dTDP-4-dehydrorhamnose 3,5-epimerase-like enzyme